MNDQQIMNDERQCMNEDEGYEILIPESVAVRVFNRRTGASCITLDEVVEHLRKHPELRSLLEAEPA